MPHFPIPLSYGQRSDTDRHDPECNLHQLAWDMHLARALGLGAVNLRPRPRAEATAADLAPEGFA